MPLAMCIRARYVHTYMQCRRTGLLNQFARLLDVRCRGGLALGHGKGEILQLCTSGERCSEQVFAAGNGSQEMESIFVSALS